MRKLILSILLLVSVSAFSQDTLPKPKPFMDTIKNAILLKPVVVNAMAKDTAYQLTWQLFGLTRDSSQGCNSYVQIFNRQAKKVADINVPIPAATLAIWTNDIVIDNFILYFLGLEKK